MFRQLKGRALVACGDLLPKLDKDEQTDDLAGFPVAVDPEGIHELVRHPLPPCRAYDGE